MMAIFGYIILILMNVGMSISVCVWFLIGGFELSNVLTSNSKADKYYWALYLSVNVWFWLLLIDASPFAITAN